MRGEHNHRNHEIALTVGSPPHARGTLEEAEKTAAEDGITPACAGNTYHKTGSLDCS